MVSFDNYYSTDSDENKQLSEKIYLALKARRPDRRTRGRAVLRPRRRTCSCRTASSRASARSAAPRTSTATPARSAAPPTCPPT
ncbi:hypothetical protein ACU4GD_15420 [Cupriavidus basilensis]